MRRHAPGGTTELYAGWHDDVLGLSRAALPEELKKWALSALRRGS